MASLLLSGNWIIAWQSGGNMKVPGAPLSKALKSHSLEYEPLILQSCYFSLSLR